jgi:Family of unknown function (DUF6166)
VTVYQGWREKKGIHVLANDLPLRHVIYHSPTGLEWGYSGSGPADLALSLLVHYFKETYVTTAFLKTFHAVPSRAWHYHQPFTFEIVAAFPHTSWRLSSDEIESWLARKPLHVPSSLLSTSA